MLMWRVLNSKYYFFLNIRIFNGRIPRPEKTNDLIPNDEGMGNHQRNCGFSLPLAVYMPVAARKRRTDFLLEAMRLPVARNWRTSASAAVDPLPGLLKIVFTFKKCHKRLLEAKVIRGTEHGILPQSRWSAANTDGDGEKRRGAENAERRWEEFDANLNRRNGAEIFTTEPMIGGRHR